MGGERGATRQPSTHPPAPAHPTLTTTTMFNASSIIQLATDAFRSVAIKHEFHLNMCRAVLKMVEQGRLVLNLQTAPYFAVKTDEEASICSSPSLPSQLPPTLYYMPEHKKARLRATYSRAKQIYRPNAAHLSRDQRTGDPIKLSGSNAATNVALWPSVMQVNLGHDYKSGESSTAPSPGRASTCFNSRSDMDVQGAIAVLDALVKGLNEEWLEAPGVEKRSVAAPAMGKSHSQQGHRVSSPVMPALRRAQSYEQFGSQALARGVRSRNIHYATPSMLRTHEYFGPPAGDTDARVTLLGTPDLARSRPQYGPLSRARGGQDFKLSSMARSYPRLNSRSRYLLEPTRSCKETYEATSHNKDRLRATFERAQNIYRPGSCVRPVGQRPSSDSKVALHGTDGALNVALYPRAMLVRLNPDEEDKLKALESTVRDAPGTIKGAIERLEALIDGVGYEWIGVDLPEALQKATTALQLQSPIPDLPFDSPIAFGSSMTLRSCSSSMSEVITPLDSTFPFKLEGENGKF